MIRRSIETVVLFAVAAALMMSLTLIPGTSLGRLAVLSPPEGTKLVCVPPGAKGTAYVDAGEGPEVKADQKEPLILEGERTIYGGTLTSESNAKSWSNCASALATGYFVFPTPKETELLIVNSDVNDASVDLTLYEPSGEFTPLGARGIEVSASSSRKVSLSVLAQGDRPIALGFKTNSGKVSIMARRINDKLIGTSNPSQAGTDLYLAGIPDQAKTAKLTVANPGSDRVAVDVMAYGATSGYQPESASGLTVPPHGVVAIELSGSLAGEASAIRVTSETPVVTSLAVGVKDDLDYLTPVVSSESLKALVPKGGKLQLTSDNKGDKEVKVIVTPVGGEPSEQTVKLAPQTTQVIDLKGDKEAQLVEVSGASGIFGAVVYSADNGTAVVPLLDAEPVELESVNARISFRLR